MLALAGLATSLAASGDGMGGDPVVRRVLDPAEDRLPPGTAIVPGLVVPDGARLVGRVFRARALARGTSPPWDAHLEVVGDPFAAWDAVAGQLRAAHPSARVPGSATSCLWSLRTVVPAGRAAARRQLLRRLVTAEPAPPDRDGLECQARTWVDHLGGGTGQEVDLHLEARVGDPITFTISGSPGTQSALPPLPALLLRSLGVDHPPPATAARAPLHASAAAVSIRPDGHERVRSAADGGPGTAIGAPTSCTGGPTSTVLQVPPGGRLLGDRWSGGGRAVLALDAPEKAIADLRRQIERGGGRRTAVRSEVERLGGRGAVWRYEHEALGPDGARCALWATPDRRFLLVERSDGW